MERKGKLLFFCWYEKKTRFHFLQSWKEKLIKFSKINRHIFYIFNSFSSRCHVFIFIFCNKKIFFIIRLKANWKKVVKWWRKKGRLRWNIFFWFKICEILIIFDISIPSKIKHFIPSRVMFYSMPSLQNRNSDDGHHPLIFVYADKGKKVCVEKWVYVWLLPSAIHVMPYNI